MSLKNLNINKEWTLFLDRDGVINKRIENDYVKCWADFEFIAGVKECIPEFNKFFGRVIVVTNQQGVGKGLYTAADVEGIHLSMMLDVILAGGQIDRVYFAPQLESENHRMRKPNTGMAELAKEDFPGIDFSKAVMVGDAISDMQFGKNKNMVTVMIGNPALTEDQKKLIDYQFKSLGELVNALG
jgi:histidinol-phosphate phosphatase family protein